MAAGRLVTTVHMASGIRTESNKHMVVDIHDLVLVREYSR